MDENGSACPDCSSGYDPSDNYCRRCGMYLAALGALPPVRTDTTPRDLAPFRAGLPAPVKKVATAIAVGTALQIGVGLAGRYFARQAAQRAAASLAPPSRKSRAVAPVEPRPEPQSEAVSETLTIRRVWMKRG